MKVEPIYRLIGFRISLEREKAEMTQSELATMIGLDRTSIANIENGSQRIMLHYIEQIAVALRIKPKELLKGIWD